MADNHFKIAVVGSGPGGKCAGAQAAALGASHVLLESSPHLSYTIFRYQKGKHVMDEPGVLPLRGGGGLEFVAGTREDILDKWSEGVQANNYPEELFHLPYIRRCPSQLHRAAGLSCQQQRQVCILAESYIG